jgi:large subunit ribosomal protein L29
MNTKELRAKDAAGLRAELIKLRREQFSLRMQSASGQAVKSHEFSINKKKIARLKTVVREQQIKAAGAKK